jgi:hypothetical protein
MQHNHDHFFDHPDMLDETCSEAESFDECDMYSLEDSMMVVSESLDDEDSLENPIRSENVRNAFLYAIL